MTRVNEVSYRRRSRPWTAHLNRLTLAGTVEKVCKPKSRGTINRAPILDLVLGRYQSAEVDYTGSISKCGDRRVRMLLYEAANVMLTRYRGKLALKDWALDIGQRSTMRKARIALDRHHHARHAPARHRVQGRLARLRFAEKPTEPLGPRSATLTVRMTSLPSSYLIICAA
jgi:transposase